MQYAGSCLFIATMVYIGKMVKSKIVKTANIVNTGTIVSSQSHGQQSQNLSCSKGQYYHTVYVVNKDNVVYMVKMVKRVNMIDKINIFNFSSLSTFLTWSTCFTWLVGEETEIKMKSWILQILKCWLISFTSSWSWTELGTTQQSLLEYFLKIFSM